MRSLFRLSAVVALLTIGFQSCKLSQPEPTTQVQNPIDSLPATLTLNDSFTKVTIPDFASVVKASVTPKGKLDRITTTYTQGNPGTVNLLYDARQRIIGRTVYDSPSKGIDNAVIYEYKDDKPYRTFTKAIQPAGTSFYFMDEMVYDTKGRHSAQLSYRVELDGQARILERNILIYDSANRVIEIKDPNGYHVGQIFEYATNNLILMSHKYANGTLSNVQTEYQYDNKPNVMKGINWTLNLDYIHQYLSNNNLIRRTFKDKITTPQPTDYTPQYDAQNRMIRRTYNSSLGLVTESYFFND